MYICIYVYYIYIYIYIYICVYIYIYIYMYISYACSVGSGCARIDSIHWFNTLVANSLCKHQHHSNN